MEDKMRCWKNMIENLGSRQLQGKRTKIQENTGSLMVRHRPTHPAINSLHKPELCWQNKKKELFFVVCKLKLATYYCKLPTDSARSWDIKCNKNNAYVKINGQHKFLKGQLKTPRWTMVVGLWLHYPSGCFNPPSPSNPLLTHTYCPSHVNKHAQNHGSLWKYWPT